MKAVGRKRSNVERWSLLGTYLASICLRLVERRSLVIAIFSLLGLVAPLQAQDIGPRTGKPEASLQQADTAKWGVLAQLVGYRWRTANGVVRAFEWSSDGREIIESELLGSTPMPVNVYAMGSDGPVQRSCLAGRTPCLPVIELIGSIAGDGSVVFKRISAIRKKTWASVVLKERPVSDWKTWKWKYSLIAETLVVVRMEGAERFETTESVSSKSTSEPADAPWGDPVAKPPVSYTRIGAVSAAAPAGTAAIDFGAMEVFVGKRMISGDLVEILELQHAPDGSLVIQWFTYDGQKLGRFQFAAGAGGDNKLELKDYPYLNSQSLRMKMKLVSWQQGGFLFFLTEPEATGVTETYKFFFANGKLNVERGSFKTGNTLTGKPTVENFSLSKRHFVPATPELIAEAVAANQRRLEEESRQAERAAENRRAQQEERERSFAAFSGGLNAFSKSYSEARSQSQQTEDRMRSGYTQAIQEGNRRYEARMAAPAPAPGASKVSQPRGTALDPAPVTSLPGGSAAKASVRPAAGPVVAASTSSSGSAGIGKARNSDDDPMTCLGDAVTYPNPSYKGATVAKVTNTCARQVDIRICLLKDTGKWDCGLNNGVNPGAYASYWAYTTGKVFVDARYSSDNKKLASPPGR